ncbi:YggS family pyridoxal phosphate-dependent enzyme [Varunaivibrio sulfuroxidans]|uniref:Pyridoxal phosphate homeostasis protein n=1 Tax=Varunaivibrio sulfuroxidans TaxID=1773489 RepID=A0A4R3JG12_9PROT|nr:YggS family pyridoxal phosphate-dependent enzyme [Varunaivibrio sulfuroxidans]TCS64844.1 hypothetical protein EDD55_101175 [Varunaivibrio sulfuroxidans]WES29855.1 YggS family pyridoxal phosphate-dependent enzyme [Varunaivibrio sulfuroxidans]
MVEKNPESHFPSTHLDAVRARVLQACRDANRKPEDVRLVCVSKTHGPEAISPLLAVGQRVFGENRVQEAEEKWPRLKAETPEVELHLIGPLQTNKVRPAVALFDVIETVDRPKLARALSREMNATGRRLPCYIQVNIGEEPQKAGVAPADVDAFVGLCRDELGLDIVGLMCIPPAGEEPSLHFALLREMARRNGLGGLSMGMSGDFEVAIAFGATAIRIGSAIFGARG